MIHKIRQFEGLDELPVYITDETPLSPNYFDVTLLPKTLHAGKNVIRLKGNDENLKVGTAVFIEILDFNGDVIYHEVADFLYEDKSRIIVFYIYEDTPPGEATLTILGETATDLDGNPVPDEYKRVPNVKWKAYFSVDNTQRNNTEIIFTDDNTPVVTVSEKIRPYLVRDFETTQFVTQSAGTVDYKLSGENPTITLSGDRFRREHIGATVKITPNNANPAIDINVDDSTFWGTIKSVPTTASAVLSGKYFLTANDSSFTYTANEMSNCNYEIHYQALPNFLETQNLRSLGYIQVNNVDPASGDVYRAKTFIRSKGSSAAWELVDDTVLKESEFQDILIDPGSIDIKTRLGVFLGQDTIDNYWKSELTQRQNGNVVLDPTTFVSNQTLTYDSGSRLLDSMCITSNTSTTYPQEFVKVYTSGSLGMFTKTFEQNGQYDLEFNAVCVKSSLLGSGRVPYIELYISGSAFATNGTESSLGKKIGEFDIQKINPGSSGLTARFDNENITFQADEKGDGVLILKVNAGDWYISDLSIKPSFELGFNPCQTTSVIALPTEHVNDQLDFKIEYYDFENNQSKFISYCDSCEFAGGNTYIGGVKNLLTGSLFVGNGTGSGVEINGITGGYVRSVGYYGFESASQTPSFPGFAIWSGSGLTEESGEDYNGVGLEMHAGGTNGSFKFRTHPTPVFEVTTPSFFFGDATNFLSGSNGNIEIYSNGGIFHLKPNGQITGSGVHVTNGSTVLLDTAGRYADLLNLGRIWTTDSTEYVSSAPTNENPSLGTGSINGELVTSGVTYILPGETTINLDCSYDFTSPGTSTTAFTQLTFASASESVYDQFGGETGVILKAQFMFGTSPLESSGSFRLKSTSITDIGSFQGELVEWKLKTYYLGDPITDLKYKSICLRSSGTQGGLKPGDVGYPTSPVASS